MAEHRAFPPAPLLTALRAIPPAYICRRTGLTPRTLRTWREAGKKADTSSIRAAEEAVRGWKRENGERA